MKSTPDARNSIYTEGSAQKNTFWATSVANDMYLVVAILYFFHAMQLLNMEQKCMHIYVQHSVVVALYWHHPPIQIDQWRNCLVDIISINIWDEERP